MPTYNTVRDSDLGISLVDTADDTFDFTGETDGESSELLTPDGTMCYVPARTIPQESTLNPDTGSFDSFFDIDYEIEIPTDTTFAYDFIA